MHGKLLTATWVASKLVTVFLAELFPRYSHHSAKGKGKGKVGWAIEYDGFFFNYFELKFDESMSPNVHLQ